MNFGFPSILWFAKSSVDKGVETTLESMNALMEPPKQKAGFDVKIEGWSLLSLVPWTINGRDKIRRPTTINRGLKRHAQSRRVDENGGQVTRLRFRPYVSKVPWHTGPRAFLSQLFPRYGNYCGPNWSSGRDKGTPVWDKRPIDWLDHCCYCHDIGYDSHDQAELLKADLAFLECLERPHMSTKGDAFIAHIYKTMCISGLKNFLIPYRSHLIKLQSGQFIYDFGWISNVNWRKVNFVKR